jgi:hypothetical protein
MAKIWNNALPFGTGPAKGALSMTASVGNHFHRDRNSSDKMLNSFKGIRGMIFALLITTVLVPFFAVNAFGITNGQPDGTQHPYVGLADNGQFACSGTLLSPTIFLTAAHCFNSDDRVRITFDPNGFFNAQRLSFFGTYHPDPDFCLGCGGGLPGFDTHDVAIVVMESPVPTSVVGTYGQLPMQGLVDSLAMKTAITIVGYGVQDFIRGGGPPQPGAAFTRFFAPSLLIQSNDVIHDQFIKLTANPAQGKGGTCFGDSGGPNLLGGTNIVLAVNSFVTNGNCAGVTYSFRIDTPEALAFIHQFI